MTNEVRLCDLVRDLRETLALEWLAGREHARKPLHCDLRGGAVTSSAEDACPDRLHVLGCEDLEDPLAPLPQLLNDPRYLAPAVVALLLAGDCRPPPSALAQAELRLGLLYSPKPLDFVAAEIHHYLEHHLNENKILHGVFMEVQGVGVLLQGGAGVGKSELALELLTRGHRLIADDTPLFARVQPRTLSGVAPPLMQGFLEVRGLGVLNVRKLFGHSALKRNKNLQLIIELRRMDDTDLLDFDRLFGSRFETELLGLPIPQVVLPVTPGRELGILVETAVRQYINRRWGYDAAKDLSARHARLLADDGTS